MVKLGAPHGLVRLALGSDHVGPGGFVRAHSSRFSTSSGWMDAELGEGEGKQKAAWGDHPCALLPPHPPSSCGEALPRCG